MKSRTVELLTYAKAFYYRGAAECLPDTDVSNMSAILSFHDALEFCVRAIIEEESVSHGSGETLLKLIESVDKHYKTIGSPLRLPLASQINGLNTTRNNAKHHATPPHSAATQNAKVHTLAFLENTVSDFFGLTFDTISQVALVKDAGIRGLLEKAEEAIASGDYLDALIWTKQSYTEAKPSDGIYLRRNFFAPMFISRPSVSSSTFGSFDRHASDMKSIASSIGDICTSLEHVKREMAETRENLALMMMGVDFARLQRFVETTPHLTFEQNNQYEVYWEENVTATREMATEAFQFALEMIRKWEEAGVLGIRATNLRNSLGGAGRKWGAIKTIQRLPS